MKSGFLNIFFPKPNHYFKNINEDRNTGWGGAPARVTRGGEVSPSQKNHKCFQFKKLTITNKLRTYLNAIDILFSFLGLGINRVDQENYGNSFR